MRYHWGKRQTQISFVLSVLKDSPLCLDLEKTSKICWLSYERHRVALFRILFLNWKKKLTNFAKIKNTLERKAYKNANESFVIFQFLAHLSWKLKWAFLIAFRPSSVCLSVCLSVCPSVNFSYFRLLLKNHCTNFNQTWHKTSLGEGNSSLF